MLRGSEFWSVSSHRFTQACLWKFDRVWRAQREAILWNQKFQCRMSETTYEPLLKWFSICAGHLQKAFAGSTKSFIVWLQSVVDVVGDHLRWEPSPVWVHGIRNCENIKSIFVTVRLHQVLLTFFRIQPYSKVKKDNPSGSYTSGVHLTFQQAQTLQQENYLINFSRRYHEKWQLTQRNVILWW